MQVVSFHDLEELPDLIRFRLAVDFLQVFELRDLRVHEYVVTPSNTRQTEAERFHERNGFREAYGPVPSSLPSDRSAPLRPLTHTLSTANNRTTPLAIHHRAARANDYSSTRGNGSPA